MRERRSYLQCFAELLTPPCKRNTGKSAPPMCALALTGQSGDLLLVNGKDYLQLFCTSPKLRSKLVLVEEFPPEMGGTLTRYPPDWKVITVPKSPPKPPPQLIQVEELPAFPGYWLANVQREQPGAFNVASTQLLWHVECEYKAYTSLTPLTPAGSGQPVIQWNDLVGSNNITPLHVPLDTPSQVTNYQTGATLTGRPNIQVGSDWRGIFQGNFNFFQRTRQLTYAIYVRVAVAAMAMFQDGTPFTNGFGWGYGTDGSLDNPSGTTTSLMGIKDGVGTYENSNIVVSPNTCVMIVTYDGQNAGLTAYYIGIANVSNNGGQVLVGSTYNKLGVDASGGFAIGGTYGNSDRFAHSLSICEAAIWEGVLSATDIQKIADRCFFYWGLS